MYLHDNFDQHRIYGMDYIFQKPDMDTVLAALILGWKKTDDIVFVQGGAPQSALNDPRIYCLECGGSGQTWLGNFDHHDPGQSLPPACVQAYYWMRRDDPALLSMVQYVAAVDTGIGMPCRDKAVLGLSNIFSGMRLILSSEIDQFRTGIGIFELVRAKKIDPWMAMPFLSEWMSYMSVKEKQRDDLFAYRENVVWFTTKAGLQGGFLECPLPGIHGLLRVLGCRVTIAAGLRYQGRRMVSIAGDDMVVNSLLPVLSSIETGWGGPSHCGIIGSPRSGTSLEEGTIIKIVMEGL